MALNVSVRDLDGQLKALGKLPKTYTVTMRIQRPYRSKPERVKRKYALVRICDGDKSATVVYEPLAKLVSKLPTPAVSVAVAEEGVRVGYGVGSMFLERINEGNAPTVDLRTLVV